VEKVLQFADKADTCFAWTVEQMLEEALRQIRAGEITPASAVIVFLDKPPGTTAVDAYSWRAQLTWQEEYTYLAIAQASCLRR
jgi:hypothetical protein